MTGVAVAQVLEHNIGIEGSLASEACVAAPILITAIDGFSATAMAYIPTNGIPPTKCAARLGSHFHPQQPFE
jgi:hypothetical protein